MRIDRQNNISDTRRRDTSIDRSLRTGRKTSWITQAHAEEIHPSIEAYGSAARPHGYLRHTPNRYPHGPKPTDRPQELMDIGTRRRDTSIDRSLRIGRKTSWISQAHAEQISPWIGAYGSAATLHGYLTPNRYLRGSEPTDRPQELMDIRHTPKRYVHRSKPTDRPQDLMDISGTRRADTSMDRSRRIGRNTSWILRHTLNRYLHRSKPTDRPQELMDISGTRRADTSVDRSLRIGRKSSWISGTRRRDTSIDRSLRIGRKTSWISQAHAEQIPPWISRGHGRLGWYGTVASFTVPWVGTRGSRVHGHTRKTIYSEKVERRRKNLLRVRHQAVLHTKFFPRRQTALPLHPPAPGVHATTL